ncbi:MAG: hypothetical protein B7Z66_01005 [Chromatiales bacterium 21-64-14]|nr:MAG: hypothetical protein B7Z66_01005 [Chromatiales bacterium 21-64-14]
MTAAPPTGVQAAIAQVLADLETISFVAHRAAHAGLPEVQALGPEAALRWLETGRELFLRDRAAGKAFLHAGPGLIRALGSLDPWLAQVSALAVHRDAGSAVEGFLSQVAQVCAAWGRDGETRWFEAGRPWLARDPVAAGRYFSSPFLALAGGRGPDGVEALLAPAQPRDGAAALPLDLYLSAALDLREAVGLTALAHWARRGADVLRATRQRGEAYFRLESPESVDTLLEAMPGFSTRRRGRLLQLLLIAWLDGPLVLEEGPWRPGKGRAAVATDGERLRLPAQFPDQETAILAVLHGAGHLRFGTYAPDAAQALSLAAGIGYHTAAGAPEAHAVWEALFPAGDAAGIRHALLFDLCEDLRVDARLARCIPGYLSRVARLATAAPRPAGAAGPYHDFTRAAVRGASGQAPLDPRLGPLVEPGARPLDALRIAAELTTDPGFPPLQAAARAAAYLPGRGPNAPDPGDPRDARAAPASGARPEVSEPGAAAAPRKRCREAREKPPVARAELDRQVAAQRALGGSGGAGFGIPAPARSTGPGVARTTDRLGVAYPEWDYQARAYREDWAWVQEKSLEGRDPERAARLWADSTRLRRRLRRALQRQRPRRLAPLRRQRDGDELDLEATVGYVSEKRAGWSPRPDVYRRRAPRQRDTAVLLLADLSTSIMAQVQGGRGKVVDRLRAALLVFADALEEVGDPYAIRGFASKYHDGVEYYRIKDFGRRLDADTRAAIADLWGRLASRMGAAIRHAVTELRSAPADRRLLLILSDGRPADYDDGGDLRYLHQDTRMAMKEAMDAGVHPFCVTLDPAGREYLPAIFGPQHYLVLDHVDDLPARLPEIYLRLRR